MKTIVNFILDKSGSMEDQRDATIGGFNEYVTTLKKKKKGEILFSLTLFDTEFIHKYVVTPLSKVAKLTRRSYNPDGMTALYDAVVETVEAASAKIDEIKGKTKSLVVIMTDGMENSSTQHDQNCLIDLIKELEKENWTFVFLGANQDSWATAGDWGLSTKNIANWDNSSTRSVNAAFVSLASDTANYTASATTTTTDFFSKKDLSNDS